MSVLNAHAENALLFRPDVSWENTNNNPFALRAIDGAEHRLYVWILHVFLIIGLGYSNFGFLFTCSCSRCIKPMVKNFLPIGLLLVGWSLAQDEPRHQPVKIIDGPVVEMVTDSSAQIAWSTNENAGTRLHYGTDRENLDQAAGMPWGGITHRVLVKDLQPSTIYYFKAESDDGQGTGTRDQSSLGCFHTVAAGQPKLRNANCTMKKSGDK